MFGSCCGHECREGTLEGELDRGFQRESLLSMMGFLLFSVGGIWIGGFGYDVGRTGRAVGALSG